MTTLKIRHGSESGSEAPRNQARPETHTDDNPGHAQRSNRSNHALDNTPARHRELETQGNHVRSKVDHPSEGEYGSRQSRQFNSSTAAGPIGDKGGKILRNDNESSSRLHGERDSE